MTIIDAKDYRTTAAKEARDAAYQAGHIPLLAARWADVQSMVACARTQLAAHTDGGADMFTNGQPEQTLIWKEDDVWCRARLDWLRPGAIDDYKTTPQGSANPDTWSRSLFFAGHDLQAAWYPARPESAHRHGCDVPVCAAGTVYAPYALAVVGLGPDAMTLAEKKILYALEVWRASLATNKWAGYPRRTCWASLPMSHEAWWLEKELR